MGLNFVEMEMLLEWSVHREVVRTWLICSGDNAPGISCLLANMSRLAPASL